MFVLIFILCYSLVYSQTISNVFSIRSYDYSIALSLKNRTNEHFAFGPYGTNVLSRSLANGMLNRYIYHGQEYDKEFGVYFFPFRTYDARSKRFMTPDPKSQYYSPYLFVGADPVNFIDTDGNEGKPLVLYGEESRPGGLTRKSAVVESMEKEIDAHYYPISDFVNGDVPLDIPDWNGNIFFESHLEGEGDIASEYYYRGEKIKLNKKFSGGVYDSAGGEGYFGFVRRGAVAERLADLTEKTGVPIKNITFGGCEGAVAADEMTKTVGKVFRKRGIRTGNIQLKGVNNDVYTAYMSPELMGDVRSGYLEAPGKIIGKQPSRLQMYLKNTESTDGVVLDYSGERPFFHNGRFGYPVIEGERLHGFVNGEVPPEFRSRVTSFEARLAPRAPRSTQAVTALAHEY